ncbi:MAG: hypothetical protein K0S71_2620 [Clostridia bacterium]|jgi:hypothetical protein|nr:hypothetical protein [Clostridia bacterium]
MNRNNVRAGIKLLLISIIFRIISFVFFSFSWQWPNIFVRAIEIVVGLLFLVTWLIYGLRKKAGFKNGLVIGLVGTSDALLLMLLSLVLYVNRGAYYFGPIEMMVWNIPLLGILNISSLTSNIMIYVAPFLAIFLTAIGSFIRKSEKYSFQEKA